MKDEMVTATKKVNGVEYGAMVHFQVPETCEEMKEQWGDSIGVSNAVANARIGLQAAIRRRVEKAIAEAEKAGTEPVVDEQAISTELSGYKPGEAAAKKDPIESLLGKFQSLPEDKQADLLKQLKDKAKGK
jgi:hypothetical protein